MTPFRTAFLLQLVAIVGCQPEELDPKYQITAPEEYCAAFEDAYCDHAVLCGASATRADCAPYAAELRAGCELNFANNIGSRIDAGVVKLNYAAASGCMNELASACGADLYGCLDEAFQGLRALGAMCQVSDDCEPAAWCQIEGDACPGTCVARVAEGGACEKDGLGSSCAAGLKCMSGTCAAGVAHGESCPVGNCREGLVCDAETCKTVDELRDACPVEDPTCFVSGVSCRSSTGQPTTCRSTFAVFVRRGAACDPGHGAGTATPYLRRLCQLGLRCDATGGTCVDLLASGAPCDPASEPPACAQGAFCDDSTETCTPLPGEGAACEGACSGVLKCVNDVCTALAELGAACTENLQCGSGACTDGTCTPKWACGAAETP